MTMCVSNTSVEDHRAAFGLLVKREDLCCPGGPNFSKTRGVWAHIAGRPEEFIGVLDTVHSQGGWAVARACVLLGKSCIEYYPVRKADRSKPFRETWGDVQRECCSLGAGIVSLPAGRSSVLYYAAQKRLVSDRLRLKNGGLPSTYMMPNALKLPEMITETAAEVARTQHLMTCGWNAVRTVLVSASSGTIAAGVLLGLIQLGWSGTLVIHQGYSRPQDAVRRYMDKMIEEQWPGHPHPPGTGGVNIRRVMVDECYSYADAARSGPTPPWPCNKYYDLKALRWWVTHGRAQYGEAIMWNIG